MTNQLVEKIGSEILAKLANSPEVSGVMVIECSASGVEDVTKALTLPDIQEAMKATGVVAVLRINEDGEQEMLETLQFTSIAFVLASEMLAKFIKKSPEEIRNSCTAQAAELMNSMNWQERLKFLEKHF